MERYRLGRTDLALSVIGYGAFKIGRNQKVKYPRPYDLPSDDDAADLLRSLRELGVTYFDTAPAYGVSEARLGGTIGPDASCVISTKVGEHFEDGESRYDYGEAAVRTSIDRSRAALGRDRLDLVFVHSNGEDLRIQRETPVVATLESLRAAGAVTAIGFSGKTVEGARAALDWADALMVEYHPEDRSHESVLDAATSRGVGIVVKKGLSSGRLDPATAIPFILSHPGVTSLVIGGLNLDHMRRNLACASLPGS